MDEAKQQHMGLVALFWVLFCAGLLVQVFAPRLKVEHNAFVMSAPVAAQTKEIHPMELVARARRMQLLSGLLTLGGAVGLAIQYREALFGRRLG